MADRQELIRNALAFLSDPSVGPVYNCRTYSMLMISTDATAPTHTEDILLRIKRTDKFRD